MTSWTSQRIEVLVADGTPGRAILKQRSSWLRLNWRNRPLIGYLCGRSWQSIGLPDPEQHDRALGYLALTFEALGVGTRRDLGAVAD